MGIFERRRKISNKIKVLRREGKTQKEAVAIALSMFPKKKT